MTAQLLEDGGEDEEGEAVVVHKFLSEGAVVAELLLHDDGVVLLFDDGRHARRTATVAISRTAAISGVVSTVWTVAASTGQGGINDVPTPWRIGRGACLGVEVVLECSLRELVFYFAKQQRSVTSLQLLMCNRASIIRVQVSCAASRVARCEGSAGKRAASACAALTDRFRELRVAAAETAVLLEFFSQKVVGAAIIPTVDVV